jgi:hypothetical protein
MRHHEGDPELPSSMSFYELIHGKGHTVYFIESKFLMSELGNADQKKIRKALENAKQQSAIWCKPIAKPAASGNGIINPLDAQPYLKQCLDAVEKGLVEMAQRFSPVQWLWYMRRFPYIHDPDDDFSFENYSQTLAAILSSRS